MGEEHEPRRPARARAPQPTSTRFRFSMTSRVCASPPRGTKRCSIRREGQLPRDENPAVHLDGVAERRHRVRGTLDHVKRSAHGAILGAGLAAQCNPMKAAAAPRRVLADLACSTGIPVAELPADPVADNVPRQVPGACYTAHRADAGAAPRLLGWSHAGRRARDRAASTCRRARRQSGPARHATLRGTLRRAPVRDLGRTARRRPGDHARRDRRRRRQPPGAAAQGAGRTPYSRTADGRAVLRSSLREFICSEAMHFLGVPTTRVLSLAATGEPVIRDMFYDGHPAPEPGAVVCRWRPRSCASATSRSTPPMARWSPCAGSLITSSASFSRDTLMSLGIRKCAAAPRCFSSTGCAWASCTG